MIPTFEKGSKERELLEKRVAMCCAAQSREIDKTKIGEAVKGTPAFWKQKFKVEDSDTPEEREQKEFFNRISCNQKPYFFRYNYEDLNRDINKFIKKANYRVQDIYDKTYPEINNFKSLLRKDYNTLSDEEKLIIDDFNSFVEKDVKLLDSDCVMNRICHYIESVDFEIKKKIRNYDNFDYKLLMSKSIENFDDKKYKKICNEVNKSFVIYRNNKMVMDKEKGRRHNQSDDSKTPKENLMEDLENGLLKIEPNEEILSNYLLKLFYEDKPSYNKSILWEFCGRQVYFNVLSKTPETIFPIKNKNGKMKYLYENYSLERIDLRKEEKNV